MADPAPPPAPLLVIATGNPSRGDDALGPALLDALRGRVAPDQVELLTDFQLQVEHVLDLAGRRAVLFVDAARPGVVTGVRLTALAPSTADPPQSHALRPEAVLGLCPRVLGTAPPPAWGLALEGTSFGLGDGLGTDARRRLAQAIPLALGWVADQLATTD